MAITPTDNNAYISIALGNGDIRTFPKGATLIDLIDNKVIVKDISVQPSETVTLDWSDIAGTPYANNVSLHAALTAYLDTGTGGVVTEFHSDVALGKVTGATTWNKFGYNEDVDVGTELIASWGGTFQYLTSGETIDIVSTSTDDDLVGAGAQQLIVYGVDENWDEQIETVEMDGTSTVTTTSQWIGINRVSIYKADSTVKQNVGTITVTANSSGYTMAQMPAGQGTTQQCIFYVPASHTFLAEWFYFNIIKPSGQSPRVDLLGWVYSDVATAEFEVYRDSLDTSDGNHIEVAPPLPFVISEKSILWFTSTSDKADTNVRGRFSGELIAD